MTSHSDSPCSPASASGSRRSKRQRKKPATFVGTAGGVLDSIEMEQQDTQEQQDQSQGNEYEHPVLTVASYRKRLVQYDKELYKDPPVLPVLHVQRLTDACKPPKRNSKTGEFKFCMSPDDEESQQQPEKEDKDDNNGKQSKKMNKKKNKRKKDSDSQLSKYYDEFRPNKSPEEIMREGAFGGTYWRDIHSAVLGHKLNGKQIVNQQIPKQWIEGFNGNTMLFSQTYREAVNKYKVKCGGSLGMWESSGWISDMDPYGWFQWYCNFFQGRRTTDDKRQLSRALKFIGATGRFRLQLMNKIISAGASYDNPAISPVIRQNLLHWGYELTGKDFLEYKKTKSRK